MENKNVFKITVFKAVVKGASIEFEYVYAVDSHYLRHWYVKLLLNSN